MCKVAGVTKITDKNREQVWMFMKVLGNLMSVGNKDGLGYAAFDKAGKLFGERWLINEWAFRDFSTIKGLTAKQAESVYSFFGESVKRDEAQAIILHTRMATCEKGIKNTHPFVDSEENPTVAIIHNGMIYNDEVFTKKFSSCDSEVLAHLYKDADVASNLKNIHEFVNKLMGWFTVLNLSTDKDGNMVMDAYTDTGRLASYFIPELDTRVFSTYRGDIEETAKIFNYKITHCLQYKKNTMFRMDVKTGMVTVSDKWRSAPAPTLDSFTSQMFPEIVSMSGNLDDEDFKANWLGRLGSGYNGD
jgi:predicted glutamine amidotransferase